MSDTYDPTTSSLDPEMLRLLEAAQAGVDSPLLDDGPVVVSDAFRENAPVIATADATPDELPVAPTSDIPSEVPSAEPTEHRAPREEIVAPNLSRSTAPDVPPSSSQPSEITAQHTVESDDVNWFEDEAPMTQSMLDDMVMAENARREALQQEATPPLSPTELDALLLAQSEDKMEPEAENVPATDAPLSQADLDAMLNAQDPPAAETTEIADDGPLSQADLDAMLNAQDPPAAETTEIDDDGPLSQADLDAMLNAQDPPAAETTEIDDDGPLSQADLDAMLNAQDPPAAATTEINDDGPLSQADLDALLSEQEPSSNNRKITETNTNAPKQEPTPTDNNKSITDTPLTQADLDALLAEEAASEAVAQPEVASTQDDLDALIAGLADAANSTPEAPVDNSGPLSQEDLDALLAEEAATTSQDQALSQEDLDLLLAGGAASSAVDQTLSQADLDALLAAASSQVPEKTSASPAPAPEPLLALSQEDLDALLNGEINAEKSSPTLSHDELDGLFEGAGDVLAQEDDGALDQNSIDALLSGSGEEQVLDGKQLDAPVVPVDALVEDDISLSQSSIDSLMADLDSSGALASTSAALDGSAGGPAQDDDDVDDISQDMIDALIANAQAQAGGGASQAEASEVGSENLAAAATAQDSGPALLSQSDLDRLIEESRQQDKQRNSAKQRALEDAIASAQSNARERTPAPDVEVVAPVHPRRFRKAGIVLPFLRNNAARVAACLMMGGLAAISTGLLLHINRETPGGSRPRSGVELQVAMERANEEMNRGDYAAAIEELEAPVAAASAGPLRDDALYLLLEARFRSFKGEWGTLPFDDMTAEIDNVVEQAPAHPRAPEALYWKAQLFTENLPDEALQIYEGIFAQYSEAEGMDKMLLDATKLALAQKDPLPATIHAQDLLRRFPGSRWAGEAILAIADANVMAGNEQDARTTYVRIAEAEPDSGLGAQAFLRLGKLAFDAGQYKQAIMQLTRRLETTTTTEGNDEVYLLLARAYRQNGQLNEARDTLNDLLNIFEPSPVTPDAYIEYSKVLEALGEREKAVKTAQRAMLEYPNNPNVLRNSGELYGLDGNPLAAASAYVAADEAGAADPNLLLSAARYYRAANLPEEAAKTYNRVKLRYGGSPAALTGGIEAAQLLNERGQPDAALEELKALQVATRGTDAYQPTLHAMLDIYKELGLKDQIRATGSEIVQAAQEPEVLARAAIDLMDAGDLETAQKAIDRLDLGRLKKSTAFDVLMKEGDALLSVAPQRGLEKMEEAHFGYPEARTREADQKLLRTYLATGRPAAARRMVMDLKASVADNRTDTPYLIDAANAWGDYLYENEDYRTAEFAYGLAEDAGLGTGIPVEGMRSNPEWARYQRANALLRLADYQGCLALYDEISASDSPWAGEAAVKANLARLEQRQRGVPAATSPLAQAG